MSERVTIEGRTAFVLGRGHIGSPRSVAIDSTYELVGVTDDNDEWVRVEPYNDEVGWLTELGPGRLVFIPDEA